MPSPDRGTDSPGVIAFPPGLFGGTLLLGLLLHWFMPHRVMPGLPARLIGAVLLVGSLMLAGWGRRTMEGGGTNVDPRQPATAIVTGGPFRYSRNPLYIALTAFYLGVTLLVNALWPLILLVPLLVVAQFGIVLREERYLETKFGETYLAYKRRVRRWL